MLGSTRLFCHSLGYYCILIIIIIIIITILQCIYIHAPGQKKLSKHIRVGILYLGILLHIVYRISSTWIIIIIIIIEKQKKDTARLMTPYLSSLSSHNKQLHY